MRSLLNLLAAMAVIGLAYWAYKENYAAQEAESRVEALQKRIAEAREILAVQRAEWAYLNRPDRLQELVDLNYGSLRLIPLQPSHFAEVEQVIFPRFEATDLNDPVDLSATFDGVSPEVPE